MTHPTLGAVTSAVPPMSMGAAAGGFATRKVFWEDPYLSRLATRIKSVQGREVTLCETIFYAFSGGQESDAGLIGPCPVLGAEKRGADIVYTLAEGHALAVGDEVVVSIDWPRRYRLMRLHFAAELVLELVYRLRPGVEKIGAHISEGRARIDFAWPGSIAQHLPDVLVELQRIVAANETITTGYSDVGAQRRFWRIPNFAAVPCGGTHPRATGEIGALTLKRRNIGKDKERIEISLIDAGVPQGQPRPAGAPLGFETKGAPGKSGRVEIQHRPD
jgi:Ser-tRNA(Ala) deacylase AlaX